MCGRFALGIALNELPNQFTHTVLHNPNPPTETSNGVHNYEIRGSEDDMRRGRRRVQFDTSRVTNWYPSYNIAPTNTSLIIYMIQPPENNIAYDYILEPSKFGLIPNWLKPNDPTPVGKDNNNTTHEKVAYSKELGKNQAKYFNCRRESLNQTRSVWNSCKKHRCVIPIQGYFEWKKTEKTKIPYFVHSKTSSLCYLAGFYSHNYNYTENRNVKDEYLSTFTIITVPADKSDEYDLSWLHSRKPMLLEPGSKAWFDWLDPEKPWSDDFIGAVLNSTTNKAYADIEGYIVTKDVGNTSNDGEEMIKRVNAKKQPSIGSFFSPEKKVETTKIKTEKQEDKKRPKEELEDEDKQITKKVKIEPGLKQEK
ncbi:hypothetical protein SBY92_005256 [Candida maltosa Xu316]